MALVDRLTQTDVDESRHIALNPFVEALFSILGGYHTVAQVKGFYNMTAQDETDFDALVALVTAHPNDYRRDRAVHRVRSILTFWEQGDVPGYMTVANIQDRLDEV